MQWRLTGYSLGLCSMLICGVGNSAGLSWQQESSAVWSWLKIVETSSQRCEAWKMSQGWFYHSAGHLRLITLSTFVVWKQLPDRNLPSSQFVLVGKKPQKTGAVCYCVTARTVMPLTGEPFLTLNGSKTVSASSLCSRLCLASCIYCGRECCPCCSLNNDVLLTNTSRTLNSFSWQEQSQWDRLLQDLA